MYRNFTETATKPHILLRKIEGILVNTYAAVEVQSKDTNFVMKIKYNINEWSISAMR